MLTGPNKKWILAALALFAVGIALLILPQYASYCDAAANQNQYRCATYEVTASILAFLEKHNALISAIATVFIGCFTYTLKKSSDKLWKSSERQRRLMRAVSLKQDLRTQESIRLARDEFLSTHRPKVRIKHLWLTEDIWNGQPITVNLGIVNNGTAEATLNIIGIRFVIVRVGRPIPFDPVIPNIPNLNVAGQKLPVGVWWSYTNIKNGTQVTVAESADIQSGNSELYCIGFVSYYDGAKNMRITGFCRVLTLPPIQVSRTIENCRFRKFDDPDYEYED